MLVKPRTQVPFPSASGRVKPSRICLLNEAIACVSAGQFGPCEERLTGKAGQSKGVLLSVE